MSVAIRDLETTRRYISRGLGVSHVALSVAGEIVDVVERMHGTISHTPLPVGHFVDDRARGISGFVYRLIRKSFDQLSSSCAEASSALANPTDPDDPQWIQFVAGLNGVIGDQLAEQNSPLAIRMQRLPSPAEQSAAPTMPLLLFIHGLCMSEQGWRNAEHEKFCAQVQQHNVARIAYLRYNSGRHISENGRELSALLEGSQDWTELNLIGHSMGGLLIRAALHAADLAHHSWPQRLNAAAFLGSPHHGAPLERLGNRANKLFNISAYVKPFKRLGDLRSAGIRDLRFGNLTDQDWQEIHDADHDDDPRLALNLPDGPAYLALAATLSETVPEPVWEGRHDWLVPVASGLGLSRRLGRQLENPRLTREIVPNINHLDLLSHAAVYTVLQNWLHKTA